MSNNTVRAQVSFSFKGETYTLDSVIDLDRCRSETDEPPDFHLLLSRAAGIDADSYLYEALASHDIEFSEPTGGAVRSCAEGRFDWHQFGLDRGDQDDWQAVRPLAEAIMGARDWDGEGALKAALLAAYRAGKANRA